MASLKSCSYADCVYGVAVGNGVEVGPGVAVRVGTTVAVGKVSWVGKPSGRLVGRTSLVGVIVTIRNADSGMVGVITSVGVTVGVGLPLGKKAKLASSSDSNSASLMEIPRFSASWRINCSSII